MTREQLFAVPTAVRRAEERIGRGKAAVSEARARATEIAQQCAAQPRLRPNGLQKRRLVLLCHKFRCLLRAAQHGQRESVVTRAATNLRRIVAIEFGTWRSGRNGGLSGLITFA